MNPICKFCLSGSCELGKNCANRHEKLSLKLDVKPSLLNIGAASTVSQKNRLIKPTENCQKLHTELILLKNENDRLNGKIATLRMTTNTLTKQLTEEKNKIAKVTEEFYVKLFEDEEYQCPICRDIFIKPILLCCGHMTCEWCIDKWLEKYNHCPTCRVTVESDYTHCLNMNNFIEKNMKLMPAKIRLAHEDLKLARAVEKEKSVQIREYRRQLDLKTMSLNARRQPNL